MGSRIGTGGPELQRWLASLCHFPLLGPALLSGLLFTASIPRFDHYFLAWICLVPVFLARLWLPSKEHFTLGLVAGIAWASGRTYWITETLQLYGALSFAEAVSTNTLLVFYLALYIAFFTASCRYLDFSSPLFAWSAASIWVLFEWVQNWMISGFPWQLLGYSQYLNPPLLQLGSVTGVYGLSFLIVLFNAALAQALWHRTLSTYLVLPLIFMASAHLWGLYRLDAIEKSQNPTIEVGVVQGNIPQDRKWKEDRKTWTTNHYAKLTRQLAAKEKPNLIIYPETALPLYFGDPFYASYTDTIAALAPELDIPILVGSLKIDYRFGKTQIYNRAFLLNTQGEVADFADKVHLVPFGEFLPFPSIFQYLQGLTAESGIFTHGDRHKALTIPDQPSTFGVFICYESIFPEITRALMALNPDFLVNTTNDAWFGTSSAPHQHLAHLALRAVESGRAIVRAANTGISGLIEPNGRIAYSTPLFETVTFSVDVPLLKEQTIYALYGDIFLVCCAIFLLTSLLWRQRRRK